MSHFLGYLVDPVSREVSPRQPVSATDFLTSKSASNLCQVILDLPFLGVWNHRQLQRLVRKLWPCQPRGRERAGPVEFLTTKSVAT